MKHFIRRLVARVRHRHFDEDLAREIAAHRAMLEDEALADGASPEAARHQAARRLGNATSAREAARGVWIAPWLDGLSQDVRHAARGVRASPGFTLPALAVLIITMGLTTGVYATAESVLLRPWPVPEPHRVVAVHVTRPLIGGSAVNVGVMEYRHLRDHVRSVDLVATSTLGTSVRLGVGDETEPTRARFVSGNYFEVLRLHVDVGRPLRTGDDIEGPASAVVVISHDLWQRRFHGRPDILGSAIMINDSPFTIVGVLAAGARDRHLAPIAEAWMPLNSARDALSSAVLPWMLEQLFEKPDAGGLELAGRLRPGFDMRAVEADLDILAAAFAAHHDIRPIDISVTSTAYAHDVWAQPQMQALSLLSAAVVLMLLLGCANVGNLQLARGISRGGELAVRHALGAARGRLMRESVAESLLLCLLGGGASLALAVLVVPVLMQWLWPAQVSVAEVGWRALLFASALAIAACLLAGLLPALSTTRFAGSTRYASSRAPRLRSALLAFQLAVSVVLLLGAGLLVRATHHISGAGLGFDLAGTAAVRINPPATYTEADRQQLALDIIEAAGRRDLPRVAGSFGAPYAGATHWAAPLRSPDAQDDVVMGSSTQVSPEYFDVVGIPLKAGRLFDHDSGPDEVVVSERLARWLSPDGSAIGRVFFDQDRELRVIGVVADARGFNIHELLPTYYAYRPAAFRVMLLKNEPGAAVRVRDLIEAIEPAAGPQILAVGTELQEQLRRPRMFATGAAALGMLALLLACVGTLGVFSYVVGERTREIGVRMSLGAQRRDILHMLLSRLRWPLAAGVVIGLLGAQTLGIVLDNRLYGLSPRDPMAYLIVLFVLLLAATVAIWMPARRALRIDPAITLRAE